MQNAKSNLIKSSASIICMIITLGFIFANTSHAKTALEIDASVDASLDRFRREVKGAEEFLKSAKGVLVIPGVIKGGFVIGGEYGEGALRMVERLLIIIALLQPHMAFSLGAKRRM